MRFLSFALGVVFLSVSVACTQETSVQVTQDDIYRHPRLLLRSGQEEALLRNIDSDIRWTRLHNALLSECENILLLDNPSYQKDSRGTTHSQCTETVRRVLFLSYAFRTTGDKRFLDKTKSIVLNFCELDSWNPYHFLDVAELTVAASFAYDWLYDYLDKSTRTRIVNSIRDKALIVSETGGEGSKEYNLRWMDMTNNWSQVCHSSLALGAIAIYSEESVLARRIIERSKKKILTPMNAEYPPMGAYSQGIGYWGYGTALNAIFIDAMQTFFGASSIAEQKAVPGFMQTGRYYAELLTNTLNTFAFSDNSTDLVLPEHCIFWFYKETRDPQLLYYQARLVDKFTDPSTDYKNGKPYSSKLVTGSYARHMPLMMVWGAGTGGAVTADMSSATVPTEMFYISEGLNPICTMRSGFDTEDIWLGFKAGNPSCAHGHMDVGEFMFEYGGSRFGVDLGSDSYTKIGDLKIGSLFNMDENAIRWNSLTRYNNFSHSTLTVNGKFQNLNRKSEFIEYSADANHMYAVADLTPSYDGQLASAKRTVSLEDKSKIVIEDELTTLPESAQETEVFWTFTTKASDGYSFDPSSNVINIKGKNGAGQTVSLDFKISLDNPQATPDGISVSRTPVSNEFRYPEAETAAPNHYFIRISYRIKSGCTQRMKVCILPE